MRTSSAFLREHLEAPGGAPPCGFLSRAIGAETMASSASAMRAHVQSSVSGHEGWLSRRRPHDGGWFGWTTPGVDQFRGGSNPICARAVRSRVRRRPWRRANQILLAETRSSPGRTSYGLHCRNRRPRTSMPLVEGTSTFQARRRIRTSSLRLEKRYRRSGATVETFREQGLPQLVDAAGKARRPNVGAAGALGIQVNVAMCRGTTPKLHRSRWRRYQEQLRSPARIWVPSLAGGVEYDLARQTAGSPNGCRGPSRYRTRRLVTRADSCHKAQYQKRYCGLLRKLLSNGRPRSGAV